MIQGTWDISDGGLVLTYPGIETRSLGVFALRDSTGQVERVDIFNLARRHEYAGYPVYWLGRAGDAESLNFPRTVAGSVEPSDRGPAAGPAISVHPGRRGPELLQHVARPSQLERGRQPGGRPSGPAP